MKEKLDDAIVRHKANMVADPDFKDECIWPRECDHQAKVDGVLECHDNKPGCKYRVGV